MIGQVAEARPLDRGMGVAVARRTVFRKDEVTKEFIEHDMGQVADRVSEGNITLGGMFINKDEKIRLRNSIARGALITSGRHLQHGDNTQHKRNMELFSNCSTAAASFSKFYLLLNGSGVGRSYDDSLMVVDWDYAPKLELALHWDHKDYPDTPEKLTQFGIEFGIVPFGTAPEDVENMGEIVKLRDRVIPHTSMTAWGQQEDYWESERGDVVYYRVADSREGWARALEIYETMAFQKRHNHLLILDFSLVREKGAPIAGMQNRPASGPLSIMRGFYNIQEYVVGQCMELWRQAMHVDHYFSVEVQVGGARRAARMSTKYYLDSGIFDFIRIKSDNGLWTSNNSVMVDTEFWEAVARVQANIDSQMGVVEDFQVAVARAGTAFDVRCYRIFEAVTESMYVNGEPGFINADKLVSSGPKPIYMNGEDFGSERYQAKIAVDLLREVSRRAANMKYPYITNPCGEIVLHAGGGYCVLSDWSGVGACPYNFIEKPAGFADIGEIQEWDFNVEEAVRLSVRFLMRVNLMDSLYKKEVQRTNRIGVSPTGLHEYAWARFGYGFRDLIDEEKSKEFWLHLRNLSDAAKHESLEYAKTLGVEAPHTVTTIKPAGTTSKLYGLSEGAHLPARRQYIRWVQFRGQRLPDGSWPADADPLLAQYEAKGYPVRELQTFDGMSIVGFPTVPLISRLGLNGDLVTASEATPEEQYQWVRLLEKYWIGEDRGNQVSYTLKVYTNEHDLADFRRIVLKNQPTVRCVSVMPSLPDHEMGYEYLPEEEVSIERFEEIVANIEDSDLQEDVDLDTLLCASGACPL